MTTNRYIIIFAALLTLACGVSVASVDSAAPGGGKAGVTPPTRTATVAPSPVPSVIVPTWYRVVTDVNIRETPDGLVIGMKRAGEFVLAVCQPNGWCGVVGGGFVWQGCTDRPSDFLCEAK